MANSRNSQTYAFKVVGFGHGALAEYVRQNVREGDPLTLEPESTSVAVYHVNQSIGYVSSHQIRNVLKPGMSYEAWARYIEYDDNIPVVLNIEVTIYGKHQPQPTRTSMINQDQINRDEDTYEPAPPYRASPVMFRAHPIAFVIALLLTPAIIGIVVLVLWAIISRTTHLEIDDDTVRYETGVFSKDRRALSRRAIRTVRVTQTLLDRMLNVGAIEIFTAGDVPEIRAVSMWAPNEIRELLSK